MCLPGSAARGRLCPLTRRRSSRTTAQILPTCGFSALAPEGTVARSGVVADSAPVSATAERRSGLSDRTAPASWPRWRQGCHARLCATDCCRSGPRWQGMCRPGCRRRRGARRGLCWRAFTQRTPPQASLVRQPQQTKPHHFTHPGPSGCLVGIGWQAIMPEVCICAKLQSLPHTRPGSPARCLAWDLHATSRHHPFPPRGVQPWWRRLQRQPRGPLP